MTEDRTRLAVVGFGTAARRHLEVFRELGAEVCASCNRSSEGRTNAREEGGIPRSYSDPLEMVEREGVGGIIVTVSIASITEIARSLIPLGIPILLEKPPGLSLAETEELAELASKHGTSVLVGLNRRFYSVYSSALELMGGVEAVTGVAVEWSEDPAGLREVGYSESYVRMLNITNSLHGIDLLSFFGGSGIQGTVWGRTLGGQGPRWQMGFEGESAGGTRVRFGSNWDVPGRWRLVVDAPDVRMISAPLETATLFRRGEAPLDLVPSQEDRRFRPGFYGQAVTFLNMIRTGEAPQWPACTLAEATISMGIAERLTDACRLEVGELSYDSQR